MAAGRRTTRIGAISMATGLAALSGCAGGAPPARLGGQPADGDLRNCVDPAGNPVAGSAFVVALDQPVDPRHAPVPENSAEAVVFRLLYETLTRVDCDGTVLPALATDWHASPDGLVWTFRLRRDARLARAERDGFLPLDGAAVREAWRDSRRRLLDAGSLPWPWERVLLRDIRVPAPDELEVTTATPEPDLPALMSRPEFAVAVRDPDAGPLDWPRGTRGVITDPEADVPARDLVWWPESKDRDATVARITFRVRPGADARDLSEADLLFVRDRDALAYFKSRDDLRPGPSLRSARLFLLTRHASVAAAVTGDVRRDLAARATAAIAESAAGGTSPAAGEAVSHEGDATATPTGDPLPDSLRFLYDRDDPTAGDVARRLAATIRGGTAVAEGLPADAFASRLRGGRGEAFVARLAVAPSPGLAPVQLATVAPWTLGSDAVPVLEPLTVLVARPGLAGVTAGRDGIPRLENAGWIRGSRP